MFDRVSRLAERTAVGLSRRQFLGGLGRVGLGALAFATFVGEALADQAQCIKAGGCCGPGYYYLTKRVGQRLPGCYIDSACAAGPAGCIQSTACCGGTGYCDGQYNKCYPCANCVTCNPC